MRLVSSASPPHIDPRARRSLSGREVARLERRAVFARGTARVLVVAALLTSSLVYLQWGAEETVRRCGPCATYEANCPTCGWCLDRCAVFPWGPETR